MKTFDEQFDFIIREFGEDIKLNGTETKAVFMEKPSYSTNTYYNDKIIFTREELRNGDMVFHENFWWYVINLPTRETNHNYATIRIAVNLVNVFSRHIDNMNKNHVNLYPSGITIPCIASVGTVDVNTDGLTSKLQMIVQRQPTTSALFTNPPVIFGRHTWKIITVGDSMPGLLTIYAVLDTDNNQYDNYVDGIPAEFRDFPLVPAPTDMGGLKGRSEYFPDDTIELAITNEEDTLVIGRNLYLQFECLINGEDFSRYNSYTWTQYATVEIIEGAEFATLKNNIKYVNGFDGSTSFLQSVLTGVKEGQVTVQITYKGVTATKTFNVVFGEDVYEMVITGPEEIEPGKAYDYEYYMLKNYEEWDPPNSSGYNTIWKKDVKVSFDPSTAATSTTGTTAFGADFYQRVTYSSSLKEEFVTLRITYNVSVDGGTKQVVGELKVRNKNFVPEPETDYKLEISGISPITLGENSNISLNFYKDNEVFDPTGTWKRDVYVDTDLGTLTFTDTSSDGGRNWILSTSKLSKGGTATVSAEYEYEGNKYTAFCYVVIQEPEPIYEYDIKVTCETPIYTGNNGNINVTFYRNGAEFSPTSTWKRDITVTATKGTIVQNDITGNGGREFSLNTSSIDESTTSTITVKYNYNGSDYTNSFDVSIIKVDTDLIVTINQTLNNSYSKEYTAYIQGPDYKVISTRDWLSTDNGVDNYDWLYPDPIYANWAVGHTNNGSKYVVFHLSLTPDQASHTGQPFKIIYEFRYQGKLYKYEKEFIW